METGYQMVGSKLRSGLVAAAVFSAAVNLLGLASPLFMMQIYDRVLTSSSLPTLGLLSLLFVGLLLIMGVLDALRGILLARLGGCLEHAYGKRLLRHALSSHLGGDSFEGKPLDDLRCVRAVLQSQAITAAFDLPWFPLFLLLIFLIHPVLGLVSLIAAIVLIGLVLGMQQITRTRLPATLDNRKRELTMLHAVSRQSDLARALGMAIPLSEYWASCADAELVSDAQMGDRLALISAATRMVRLLAQGAILAFGAWLVIRQELNAGVMIGSSIMMGTSACTDRVGYRQLAEARRGTCRVSSPEEATAVPRAAGTSIASPYHFGSCRGVRHLCWGEQIWQCRAERGEP